MSLHFEATLAARNIDVTLELASGETVAVLGPNGAGKSTVLGMLAGLVRPDAGRASLGDRTLFDLPRNWTPPHRRGIALLAQEPLLFPHLSVRQNVEFGPRTAGLPRSETRRTAEVTVTSRAESGSSRRSSLGSAASARAMATRCAWPPDSSPGLCLARSAMPTRVSAASALALRCAPDRWVSNSGSSTLRCALNMGIKL